MNFYLFRWFSTCIKYTQTETLTNNFFCLFSCLLFDAFLLRLLFLVLTVLSSTLLTFFLNFILLVSCSFLCWIVSKIAVCNMTVIDLQEKSCYQRVLNEWYGQPKQQWRLIFRASTHGWSAQAFHRACDGIAPTYTVVAVSTWVGSDC